MAIAGRHGGHALNEDLLRRFYRHLLANFDHLHGGFSKAPKFPTALGLMAMLRILLRTGDQRALGMVTKTLDRMALSGMYDQIGSGFHRYSTDANWFALHFEKMLYDNALLTMAYLEAYQATGRKGYLSIAEDILEYIGRDMTDDTGGFYSAEDADSEHAEGKFYLFKYDELRGLLTKEEFAFAEQVLAITRDGNLKVAKSIAEIQKAAGRNEVHSGNIIHFLGEKNFSKKFSPTFLTIRKKLMKARELRVHQALMIKF